MEGNFKLSLWCIFFVLCMFRNQCDLLCVREIVYSELSIEKRETVPLAPLL